MATVISRSDAQTVLADYFGDEDIAVALDQGEKWVFYLNTGASGRLDGKFYDIVVDDSLGYEVLVLREEPKVSEPEDGSPRIVGQVVVKVNEHGHVHVRQEKGLDGPVLAVAPSSVSKGELVDKHGPVFNNNPKRIRGSVEAVLVEVNSNDPELKDAQWMTPHSFVAESNDARSVTAVAKLLLV